MKEVEQELKRERIAVQQRQEDEQLAMKEQNPGLVVDLNAKETSPGGSYPATYVSTNNQ